MMGETQLARDTIHACRGALQGMRQDMTDRDRVFASHGLFYMENAGGYPAEPPPIAPSTAAEEHQPGCFALEEEKGESWRGTGASGPMFKETRPTL